MIIEDVFLIFLKKKTKKTTDGVGTHEPRHEKSNRKAMNRNWSNQKANPALKTKTGKKINITNRQNTMRTNC